MNKKLLLALACLALVCCVLCACNVTPEQMVLDQLSAQAKSAKSITVKIESASGDMVLAKQTITYNFQSGKKSIQTQTANPSPAEGGSAWITSNSVADIASGEVSFNWSEKDFSELALDVSTMQCTGVIGQDVLAKLGLQNYVQGTDGAINVAFSVSGDINGTIEVQSVVISYRGTNGSDVTINVTMQAA